MLEVDERGLDRLDREILRAICVEVRRAARSGLSTLAVAVGEEQDTIEDVYEPYLLQRGPDQAHSARARRDRRPPSRTSASTAPAEAGRGAVLRPAASRARAACQRAFDAPLLA